MIAAMVSSHDWNGSRNGYQNKQIWPHETRRSLKKYLQTATSSFALGDS